MKTALFTNFTDREFIGYWNGKGKKFAPGQSLYMPDYLAQHFAKHLTNSELLRTDSNGNLIHKDGDKMTSPKKPADVPIYMELFNKAYQPDELDELGEKRDDIDTLIDVANKNRQERGTKVAMPETVIPPTQARPAKPEPAEQDPTKPQVILSPDFTEGDNEDEESFQGRPVENAPAA